MGSGIYMETIKFKKEKLFIFDLDGTLYEGTDHFDYYATRLLLDISEEKKEEFLRDYNKMKKGKHPLKIGKAYDVDRDVILTLDPFTLKVEQVEDWYGKQWQEYEVNSTYRSALSFDFEHTIAIGDGWWLPFACAKHYGVTDCYPRYVETKEFMVTDQFQLAKIEGAKEWLLRLKETKKIVLVTNSDLDDVGRLLKELDLDTVFEHIISSAKKPSKTDEIFNRLIELYGVNPEEAVSVGDNFINDIAPALEKGMKGIYIDPLRPDIKHKSLIVVESLKKYFE